MKILPAALLVIGIPAAALLADAPVLPPDSGKAADFEDRAAYAKTHAEPVTCASKGGPLACTVYRVKHGAGNTPGYAFVIAKDQGGRSSTDFIQVLCDTVAIDPAHAIKCTGHVIANENGFTFVVNGFMELLAVQLGLGKGDDRLKVTGQAKVTAVN